MNISSYFKSVIDSDTQPIVICDLDHVVVYMNPSAITRYNKRGGSALIGKSLLDCHNEDSNKKIINCIEWFKQDTENNKVYTFSNKSENNDYDVYMIALRNDLGELIGYYEKHEDRKHESMPLYHFMLENDQ